MSTNAHRSNLVKICVSVPICCYGWCTYSNVYTRQPDEHFIALAKSSLSITSNTKVHASSHGIKIRPHRITVRYVQAYHIPHVISTMT